MERMTKPQFLAALAERTEMSKKEATAIYDVIRDISREQLKGTGVMVLPGLVKFVVKDIPARPEREGVNPFTKKMQTFAAKPASKRLKSTIPKAFKDSVLK